MTCHRGHDFSGENILLRMRTDIAIFPVIQIDGKGLINSVKKS